jgi:hypothetical protein
VYQAAIWDGVDRPAGATGSGRDDALGGGCEVAPGEVALGVPEADGVTAAARKQLAFMPLELFDDLEMELNSPQEWVALSDGAGGGTPAETLMYQARRVLVPHCVNSFVNELQGRERSHGVP